MAAGNAAGNKHISHIYATPVTVQMVSPMREAASAMKKDEQSGRNLKKRQGKEWEVFYHGPLVNGDRTGEDW